MKAAEIEFKSLSNVGIMLKKVNMNRIMINCYWFHFSSARAKRQRNLTCVCFLKPPALKFKRFFAGSFSE